MSYQRRGKDTHDLFYQSLYESFEVNEMDVGSAIEGRRLPDIFYLFECSAKCEDRQPYHMTGHSKFESCTYVCGYNYDF